MPSAVGMERELLGQHSAPATEADLITPSDTADLRRVTRFIRCGGAGDLAVQMVDGRVTIIPSVHAGETLDIMVRKVYATNTTATEIVGMT